MISWTSTSLPNLSSVVPVRISALQHLLEKPPRCTAIPNCWERGFSQGEIRTGMGAEAAQARCSPRGHWRLQKGAKGVCGSVSATYFKAPLGGVAGSMRFAERWWGQLGTTMSYSSMYVFIAVYWRAPVVSRLRDLVQQGRLLVAEFKEIDSCTVTSRPANASKTSMLWDWCREGL